MEREWSCYRCGKFMEGEWSYCRGGYFNGGRMVMLQKWSLYWRENGHVTMWSVLWRKNVHFTEVLTLMDICIATRGVGRISLPITKQSSPLGNASPGMNFLRVFISFT